MKDENIKLDSGILSDLRSRVLLYGLYTSDNKKFSIKIGGPNEYSKYLKNKVYYVGEFINKTSHFSRFLKFLIRNKIIKLIKLSSEGVYDEKSLDHNNNPEYVGHVPAATFRLLDEETIIKLISLFNSSTIDEPYGFSKQLRVIKESIYRKYKEFENEELIFKWVDPDDWNLLRHEEHVEIFKVLNFLTRNKYLKYNTQSLEISLIGGMWRLRPELRAKIIIGQKLIDEFKKNKRLKVKPKSKKVAFNDKHSFFTVNNKRINIKKYSNQYYLCVCLFNNLGKEYDKMDLEEEKNDPVKHSSLYTAAKSINDRVKMETQIHDFILFTTKTAKINPKYLDSF